MNKEQRQMAVKVTKVVTSFIVGSGTSGIVKSAIEQNTAPPENIYRKLTHWAGSIALGAMAADRTKDYTGTKIDQYAELLERTVARIDEAEKQKDDQPTEQ